MSIRFVSTQTIKHNQGKDEVCSNLECMFPFCSQGHRNCMGVSVAGGRHDVFNIYLFVSWQSWEEKLYQSFIKNCMHVE